MIPSLDSIYRSPALSAWTLEDHLVITTFPEPELHLWNQTAAVVWLLLLEGQKTPQDLSKELTEIFKNCPPTINDEIGSCLHDWLSKQWLAVDGRGNYSILPKYKKKYTPVKELLSNPPCEIAFQKSLSINGNAFRLAIYANKKSTDELFFKRIIAIINSFPKADSEPQSQLDIVIDSDLICLYENLQSLGQWQDSTEALSHCMQYFLRISAGIDEHFLTLHAAAIGKKNCVLLSGVSGAGKSTLCALLALRGWEYFGDDLVGIIVDNTIQGHIVPLPSAVGIKSNTWELLSSEYPIIATLEIIRYGEKTARYLPLPSSSQTQNSKRLVSAIVFPRYAKDAAIAHHSISVIDALKELVNSGISLNCEMSSDEVQHFLEFLCRTPLYQLVYSDINEANSWLSTLVKN